MGEREYQPHSYFPYDLHQWLGNTIAEWTKKNTIPLVPVENNDGEKGTNSRWFKWGSSSSDDKVNKATTDDPEANNIIKNNKNSPQIFLNEIKNEIDTFLYQETNNGTLNTVDQEDYLENCSAEQAHNATGLSKDQLCRRKIKKVRFWQAINIPLLLSLALVIWVYVGCFTPYLLVKPGAADKKKAAHERIDSLIRNLPRERIIIED